MNLTDYPTPQCDGIRFQAQPGMMPPFDTVPYTVAARIQREAAAWRAVAEKYRRHFYESDIRIANEAFDALDRKEAE